MPAKLVSILLLVFNLSLYTVGAQDEAGSHSSHKRSWLRRYINGIIADTTSEERLQFLWYPTLAYAPETKWEFGFSTLLVYYAKKDVRNRLSEINGFSFYTLENQYGFWFDHALYSDQDNFFFLGKIRIQSFPLLYHGIGYYTPKEYIARVDADQIMVRERVLRKISKNFFIGAEMDINSMRNVVFNIPSRITSDIEKPLGSEGSTNIGLGLGLVYDDRHNVLNVRKGSFFELAFLRYSPYFRSKYDFTTFMSDMRIFRPIHEKSIILAGQLFSQFNFGKVPFNQLSLLGGESLMRGYYMGRFRDHKQIASQLELRFLPIPFGFTDRIGAAVFGGLGHVFEDFQHFNNKNWIWSGGAGLRFLIFPKKDVYTRLDVAFTKEKPGFYFFVGEAF